MAVYNPYMSTSVYPQGYSQTINPPATPAAAPQMQSQMVSWVKGLEGANAYMIQPNTNVMLMDSDNPYLYIKSSDITGRISLEAYELVKTDVSEIQKQEAGKSAVTANEISQMIADAIDKKFNEYGIYKRYNKHDKKEEDK